MHRRLTASVLATALTGAEAGTELMLAVIELGGGWGFICPLTS